MGGIGAATVKALGKAGAVVVAWDLTAPSRASRTTPTSRTGNPSYDVVDITNRDAVRHAAKRLFQRTGRVDILVNNAGINIDEGDSLHMRDEVWQRTMDTNLAGAVHCTHALVPYMKRRRWGRIINTGSVLGRYGCAGMVSYVTAKAGLIGMTKVWAHEFGPHGITANLVSPGYIRTSMNDGVPGEMIKTVIARSSLRRIGEPADVAAVHLFLASAAASFITGAEISVDGGFVP